MTGVLSSQTVVKAGSAALSAHGSAEQKAPAAFRTISEVATSLDVPQHVLRFWETKFQQVKPLKRGGGRRYYRPEDVALLTQIKDLLYTQGLTIRGVQKLLRENGKPELARLSATQPAILATGGATGGGIGGIVRASLKQDSSGLSAAQRREIETVLDELKSLRDLLRQSGI